MEWSIVSEGMFKKMIFWAVNDGLMLMIMHWLIRGVFLCLLCFWDEVLAVVVVVVIELVVGVWESYAYAAQVWWIVWVSSLAELAGGNTGFAGYAGGELGIPFETKEFVDVSWCEEYVMLMVPGGLRLEVLIRMQLFEWMLWGPSQFIAIIATGILDLRTIYLAIVSILGLKESISTRNGSESTRFFSAETNLNRENNDVPQRWNIPANT